MKKDNRGFSLVELIVVVAIMVIVSSASIVGSGVLSRRAASSCATQMQASIRNNRVNAMGKKNAKLVIEQTSNGIIATETINDTAGQAKKVGDAGVTVTYSTDNVVYSDLPAGGLTVSFVRSSGSLNSTSDLYLKATKGSADYIVHVYHLTGKVELIVVE